MSGGAYWQLHLCRKAAPQAVAEPGSGAAVCCVDTLCVQPKHVIAALLCVVAHTHILPAAGGCYLYGRSYSPTVQQLSRQLAAMEATEAAYAVASGVCVCVCACLGVYGMFSWVSVVCLVRCLWCV
jgi:hypothetical protein